MSHRRAGPPAGAQPMSHVRPKPQFERETRPTYRLAHHGRDDDLGGYVFRDAEHAREWLDQPLAGGRRALPVFLLIDTVRCSCGHEHEHRSTRPDRTRPVMEAKYRTLEDGLASLKEGK